MTHANAEFTGSIPAVYDRCLGPLLFEPYAQDLEHRFDWSAHDNILELACGTGILTTHLSRAMSPRAKLTATDLNPDMLAIAQTKKVPGNIEWRAADAGQLPFADGSFDAVACQFGVMFFPDKAAALREVRRVLTPGGLLAFSVWGSHEQNPFGALAKEITQQFFTRDPPVFYDIPFGFPDQGFWRGLLTSASLDVKSADVVRLTGVSATARAVAEGMIAGNPALLTIQERATASPEAIIDHATGVIAARYGNEPCRLPLLAVVFGAIAV